MVTTVSKNSTAKQRITLFITPAIAKQAKAQAIVEDMTLTELIQKALIQYLPTETVIKKIDINLTKSK